MNQPFMMNTFTCSHIKLSSHPASFTSHRLPFFRKNPSVFSAKGKQPASQPFFSLGEILMGLQGPSRSNYVEQVLSLTGPWLPGENTNLPGKQNSPTFDKTLNTRGYK